MTESSCSNSYSEIKSNENKSPSVHKITEDSCSDSSSDIKSNEKFSPTVHEMIGPCSNSIFEIKPNEKTSPTVHEMTEASCSDSISDTKPNEKHHLIYRCKKCRQIVAAQENIVSHEQGKGEASFGWRKRRDESDSSPECTSIFVEPLKWMQTVQEGYVWEKLYCMGCKSRLGSFNWAGMQCSCGAWVNPAFQILKSRIDECQT